MEQLNAEDESLPHTHSTTQLACKCPNHTSTSLHTELTVDLEGRLIGALAGVGLCVPLEPQRNRPARESRASVEHTHSSYTRVSMQNEEGGAPLIKCWPSPPVFHMYPNAAAHDLHN